PPTTARPRTAMATSRRELSVHGEPRTPPARPTLSAARGRDAAEGLPPGIGGGLLRGRLELIPCTAFSAGTLACGLSVSLPFERTETISEHGTAKPQCPKCGSKKVSVVPPHVYVVTSKKS